MNYSDIKVSSQICITNWKKIRSISFIGEVLTVTAVALPFVKIKSNHGYLPDKEFTIYLQEVDIVDASTNKPIKDDNYDIHLLSEAEIYCGQVITVYNWKGRYDRSYVGDAMKIILIQLPFIKVKHESKAYGEITLDLRQVEIMELNFSSEVKLPQNMFKFVGNLPKWKDFEFTGEFRIPNVGEYYVLFAPSGNSYAQHCETPFCRVPHFILRKKEVETIKCNVLKNREKPLCNNMIVEIRLPAAWR